METLSPQSIKALVEKVVWFLRRENIYVSSCEIREKASKFEVYLKLERNVAGLSTIKLVLSKSNLAHRVFTGKASLDIRLRRFIQRELLKMVGGNESAT